ncbi:uncharacterized protein [Physcomitrium patens]|uniref:uncharacterized protein isoform X2 n=1 Tax=Physcomitrium patens TaxID=3218 RepID=UPI003CCDCED5
MRMRQRKRGSLSKVCSLLEEYMWVHLGVVESNSRLSLLSVYISIRPLYKPHNNASNVVHFALMVAGMTKWDSGFSWKFIWNTLQNHGILLYAALMKLCMLH